MFAQHMHSFCESVFDVKHVSHNRYDAVLGPNIHTQIQSLTGTVTVSVTIYRNYG